MDGRILTAKVQIRGTRALFQHWFGPDAIPLEKGEKTGVAGNDPEEWRRTCLIDKNGQLFVLGSYIFGATVGGGKTIKRSRANISASIASTLQIGEERIVLDRYFPGFPNGQAFNAQKVDPPERDESLPVYLDVRSVVNPVTKSRNVRYRVAASPSWQCVFTLVWDKTVVSRSEMEAALIDAGRLVGLGNGRKIGMGRFEVVSFEVQE